MAISPEWKIHIRFKGGRGVAQKWEWEIWEGGKVADEGDCTGARANAEKEANGAMRLLKAHRRAGKKGKPRKPVKWGNFI